MFVFLETRRLGDDKHVACIAHNAIITTIKVVPFMIFLFRLLFPPNKYVSLTFFYL